MICRACGYENAPTLEFCNLCGESLSVLPPRPRTEQFKRSDLGLTKLDRAIAQHTGKKAHPDTKEGAIAGLREAQRRLADRLTQLMETHDQHASVLQAQIDTAHETREVEAQIEAAQAELKVDQESLRAAQEQVQELRKKVVDIRQVLNRAIELRLEALTSKKVLGRQVEHLRHLREALRKGPPVLDDAADGGGPANKEKSE